MSETGWSLVHVVQSVHEREDIENRQEMAWQDWNIATTSHSLPSQEVKNHTVQVQVFIARIYFCSSSFYSQLFRLLLNLL